VLWWAESAFARDDASAQTVFESATRGWGTAEHASNDALQANSRVKKGKIGIIVI
jgi:hypothetical protein